MHYPVAKEGTYRSEACTFDNVQPGSIKFRPSSASAVKARRGARGERERGLCSKASLCAYYIDKITADHTSLRTLIRAWIFQGARIDLSRPSITPVTGYNRRENRHHHLSSSLESSKSLWIKKITTIDNKHIDIRIFNFLNRNPYWYIFHMKFRWM